MARFSSSHAALATSTADGFTRGPTSTRSRRSFGLCDACCHAMSAPPSALPVTCGCGIGGRLSDGIHTARNRTMSMVARSDMRVRATSSACRGFASAVMDAHMRTKLKTLNPNGFDDDAAARMSTAHAATSPHVVYVCASHAGRPSYSTSLAYATVAMLMATRKNTTMRSHDGPGGHKAAFHVGSSSGLLGAGSSSFWLSMATAAAASICECQYNTW
mmetsp:Transcript_11633/g.36130  ORF Transcript_11633/g.36130 Transcript_11633/m.36130 type:complete len:217 (+) Transcript_11633:1195-1845(+)